MATDALTLSYRTRRWLRDLPLDQLPLTASSSSSATTITVSDTTRYAAGDPLELESEILLCTAVTNATTLTVTRGIFGSTAASHASGTALLRRPGFFTMDILDALNMAIQACFPRIYKEVVDESTTMTANVWEYTIPNMSSPAIPIPYIADIQVKATGDIPYKRIRSWELLRGSTPKIKFRRSTAAGDTMRIRGYGPFPLLTSTSDSLDTQFPQRCEYLLSMYAAGTLLEAGEAGRVRSDRGMSDDREQANRTGSSLQVGAALISRFYTELERMAMPPLATKHVRSVI